MVMFALPACVALQWTYAGSISKWTT